jgi:rare lipoprotein A
MSAPVEFAIGRQWRRVPSLGVALLMLALAACATPSVPPVATPGPGATYRAEGIASWYGPQHQGKLTASGERFDMRKLTAAHRTLPLDTRLRVTNLENGRTVTVTVNDRGPFVRDRIIDLSAAAARALDMKEDGIARVRLEVRAEDQSELARR